MSILEEINLFITNHVLTNFHIISNDRKQVLFRVINFIQTEIDNNSENINLLFVCTHNSRRSQFTQVWAHIASYYYNINNINCYSGGTETTECNERTIEALKRNGIKITKEDINNNPKYYLLYSNDISPIICYSKLYKHQDNPQNNFAAIMTCSDADTNCPYIPGVKARIPLRYNDPKEFDNTHKEKEKYDEKSLEIATEIFYIFSQLKQ